MRSVGRPTAVRHVRFRHAGVNSHPLTAFDQRRLRAADQCRSHIFLQVAFDSVCAGTLQRAGVSSASNYVRVRNLRETRSSREYGLILC